MFVKVLKDTLGYQKGEVIKVFDKGYWQRRIDDFKIDGIFQLSNAEEFKAYKVGEKPKEKGGEVKKENKNKKTKELKNKITK